MLAVRLPRLLDSKSARHALAAALVVAGVVAVSGGATATTALASTTSGTSSNALIFGVYPGGPAGGATGSNPDNVSKDLAAVKQLDSSGAPFMVHLYAEYYGPGSYSAQQEIGAEVQTFAQAGIKVELVVCYRPTDDNPSVDVPGFASWTQSTLGSLGKYLSYLQVTNEANESGDPSSNDGAYPGAENALIQGVESAKSYITAHGESTQVGFNWNYDAGASSSSFWSYLQTAGGSTFLTDVDWVGIDVYPGTWQTLPAALDFSDGVGQVITQAMSTTRSIYMPLAGLPSSVPIQISETGYPTGAGRTDAAQESALDAEVNAVNGLRTVDNVTAMQFFDLRDAITDSTIFEDQYGLMTDQWVAKPAFTEYQSLVAQLGGAPTSNATRGEKTAIPANPPTSAPSTMSPKNTPVTTATGQSSPAVTQTATESSAKGKRHKRRRKATEHRHRATGNRGSRTR
jgi:hypothetical protein